MKIIRFNESNINKKKIEIGDYVICNEYDPENYKFDDFNILVNNNIGKVIDINGEKSRDDKYVVQYDNIPESLHVGYLDNKYESAIRFLREEIKYSSKDKSKLEIILVSKKYNI